MERNVRHWHLTGVIDGGRNSATQGRPIHAVAESVVGFHAWFRLEDFLISFFISNE